MMKKIIFLCYLPLLLLYAGCKKEQILDSKPGVSLPMVTNLVLQKAADDKVKLTWNIPSSIPDQIQQPLSVYIEVNEIKTVTTATVIFSVALPEAPTEFIYQLPDAAKKYHFTIKLLGNTKTVDKNYSSVIYSLGQTVNYNE